MNPEINLEDMKAYFEQTLEAHGATPRGVDWNSEASQELRFDQLAKLLEPKNWFSIIDYGCGYGALVNYLIEKGFTFQYTGYDFLESMVDKARKLFQNRPDTTFIWRASDLEIADYCVASGIFNLKLEAKSETWTEYVLGVLNHMNQLSAKGLAFNMLTKYSDADRMRPDLYYADPCYYFDYCKTHFARNVALLHDYGAYDFTIIVRKQV